MSNMPMFKKRKKEVIKYVKEYPSEPIFFCKKTEKSTF